MSTSSDLKKLEQKIYLSYHQDGLLDIIVGAVILCLGLKEVIDSSIWNFLSLLLIVAYVPLKKKFTFPRLGYAKFNIKRGGINLLGAGVISLGFLLLLSIGIVVLQKTNGLSSPQLFLWIRENPLLFYGIIGFIGFGATGLTVGLYRLLGYALLALVFFTGGHFLGLQNSLPFLFLASLILITGFVLLIRFQNKLPVIKDEEHDNQ